MLQQINKITNDALLIAFDSVAIAQWCVQLTQKLALITDNLLNQQLALVMLNCYSN